MKERNCVKEEIRNGSKKSSYVEEDEAVAKGEGSPVLFTYCFYLPSTVCCLSSLQLQDNFHPLERSHLK